MADLADKTPVFHAHPNVFHRALLIQDLLGQHVPLSWRIPLAGGSFKPDPRGGTSVHFHEAPESETVRRWKAREFKEVERLRARHWRASLSGVDFTSKVAWVQRLVPLDQKVTNLDAAKAFADSFVNREGREVLTFAGQFLEIPNEHWPAIERRYAETGRPPLSAFAPYAAFVLTIDLVFYLGMVISQISAARKSNVIDLSYLYYLPFCMVFTSGDNLHARLAPRFMRPDQVFVRSVDLKEGLRQLNEHYMQHRDEIERVGVVSYASEPPSEPSTIVFELWERCLPRRERTAAGGEEAAPSPSSEDLLERIKQITESGEQVPGLGDGEPESVVLESTVPVRRGSWRLVPEGIEHRVR